MDIQFNTHICIYDPQLASSTMSFKRIFVGALLIYLVEDKGCLSGSKFKALQGMKKRQVEAGQACADTFGSGWHLADGQSNQGELYGQMRAADIRETWLAATRKDFDQWTWMNGKSGQIMEKQDMQDMLCASVSVQHENQPIAVKCTGGSVGFCCEFKESSYKYWCGMSKDRSSCTEVDGRWFLLDCTPVSSWQQARAQCLKAGGDLAIVNSSATFKAVYNLISNRQNSHSKNIDCRAYVGLRMQEWFINHNGSVTPILYFQEIEGASVSSRCVSIIPGIHHSKWKATDCDVTLPVVCQMDYRAEDFYSTKQEEYLAGNVEGNSNSTVCIVVPLVIALLILGGAVFVCYKKGAIKRCSGRPIHKKVKILQEKVTVVMFSEGVLKTIGCEVKNYPSFKTKEGTATAQFVLNEYNKFIGAMKPKDSGEKGGLRIFNLSYLSGDEEILNRDKASETLTFLLGNIEAIDIVYLPGLATDIGPENITRLHELRKSCVVLTFAKAKTNEVTAAESLAFIGERRHDENQIYTGLVDIQVKLDQVPKTQKCHLDEAIARATGFVAGVLQYSKYRTSASKEQGVRGSPEHAPFIDINRLRSTKGMREFLIDLTRWQEGSDLAGFGSLKLSEETYEKAKNDLTREPTKEEQITPLQFNKSINTRESIKECLHLPTKMIKIAICSSPILVGEGEQHVVLNNNQTGEEFCHGNIVKNLVVDCLADRFGGVDKINNIQIHNINIRLKDVGYRWQDYSLALRKVEDELKPDIVYLSGTKRPPDGRGIKSKVIVLPRKFIMLSAAMVPSEVPPETKCSFPAENMLAVSYEKGPQSSLVGFISDTPLPGEYHQSPYDDSEACAANAAADTICAILAILTKIQELGFDDAFRESKDKTGVMRNILINLCDEFPHHSPERGYGVLRPSAAFREEEKIKNIIQSGIVNPPRYWKGKNI